MAATYSVINGKKVLVFDDGSNCDVTAPLSLEEGSAVRLVEAQRLLLAGLSTNVQTLVDTSGGTIAAQVQAADDLAIAYTYLDAGTADQRIATVTYSSAAVGESFRETFTYAGSAGAYYVVNIARAVL